jgi:hypothetical protein
MKFLRMYRVQKEARITHRRVLAAQRAIDRDLASVPLFPELVKHVNPVKRIEEKDAEFARYFQRLRDHEAQTWKRARAKLRARRDRAEILEHWQRGIYPASATYLAGLLHSIETGRFSISGYYAEIERSKELLRIRAMQSDAPREEAA